MNKNENCDQVPYLCADYLNREGRVFKSPVIEEFSATWCDGGNVYVRELLGKSSVLYAEKGRLSIKASQLEAQQTSKLPPLKDSISTLRNASYKR